MLRFQHNFDNSLEDTEGQEAWLSEVHGVIELDTTWLQTPTTHIIDTYMYTHFVGLKIFPVKIISLNFNIYLVIDHQTKYCIQCV